MNGPEQSAAPRRARGCLRDAAIVVCVLIALVLVVGAAAYFAFVMTDHTLQQEDLANLTDSEVRADLADLRLSDPDLSSYAYVSNEVLDGPRFGSIDIGAIRYGGMKDGRLMPTTREVTCQALWQNSYASVVRPLTAEFEFVSADEGWKLVIYTLGDMRVTPLRPMNVYDLEEDVVPLLRLYDPVLGDAYLDAHVALTSDLTVEGGTVRAVLTKASEEGPMECTVELSVSWASDHGWAVEVTEATSQPEVGALRKAEEEALAPEPSRGDMATQSLTCHTGDLVKLTGTLVQSDGVFVLETALTEVNMAGRSWTLDRFAVTGPSARLTESLRKKVEASGYLTVGYALPDAPLSLAVKTLS